VPTDEAMITRQMPYAAGFVPSNAIEPEAILVPPLVKRAQESFHF